MHQTLGRFLVDSAKLLSVAQVCSHLHAVRALTSLTGGSRLAVAAAPLFVSVEFSNYDLMENFSLFARVSYFTMSLYALIAFLAVYVVFVSFRGLAAFCVSTVYPRVGLRVAAGTELKFIRLSMFYMTLFVIILLSNVYGLIPMSYTVTSGLAMPVMCGLFAFLFVVGTLIKSHGVRALGGFWPVGTNVVIAPLVVIVEILSFFAKFCSLVIRLFANLFAGHLLLKVLYIGLSQLVSYYSLAAVGSEVIFFLFTTSVLVLEMLLAALQAVVFLALILIYYRDAVQFLTAH
jgi:F-type H+-transporting ATPase subunit a